MFDIPELYKPKTYQNADRHYSTVLTESGWDGIVSYYSYRYL